MNEAASAEADQLNALAAVAGTAGCIPLPAGAPAHQQLQRAFYHGLSWQLELP